MSGAHEKSGSVVINSRILVGNSGKIYIGYPRDSKVKDLWSPKIEPSTLYTPGSTSMSAWRTFRNLIGVLQLLW